MKVRDFHLLEALMRDFTEKRDIPGVDLTVAVGYDIVYRFQTGYADRANRKPITDNTQYFLYSASKPITCAAVLRLVERGDIDLAAPLSDYLPEFANLTVDNGTDAPHPANNPLTVRDLFCMTNGYSYEYSAKIAAMQGGNCATLPTVLQLAKLPLRFEPHTAYAYGLGHDILAALAERVTGKKYRDYLAEVVFEPLGMTRTHMHPTAFDRENLAQLYRMTDGVTHEEKTVNTFIFGDEYDSGGAGIISCPEDYIKFAMTMTGRGLSKNGYRLLLPETVELMRKPHLNQAEFAAFNSFGCNLPGYSYGLGVRTHIDPSRSGRLSPVGEFGWDGAAGAFTSFDPENSITIYYAQHVIGTPHAVNHKDILNTVYRALGV